MYMRGFTFVFSSLCWIEKGPGVKSPLFRYNLNRYSPLEGRAHALPTHASGLAPGTRPLPLPYRARGFGGGGGLGGHRAPLPANPTHPRASATPTPAAG